MGISLNTDFLKGFVSADEIKAMAPAVLKAHNDLHNKTGAGNDFVGWVDLPSRTPEALLRDLADLAKEVQGHSEAIISIGIGGSYLGIRASLEFLGGDQKLPLYYAGHNMATADMARVLKLIEKKNVTVVVISKSGATTEPALAFRLVDEAMRKRHKGEDLKKRIVCVTDAKKGALRQIADKEGYRAYVIPDDVGGRFSVLTPVGLVPLALAGVDVRKFVDGFRAGEKEYGIADVEKNTAYQYAAIRNILNKKGKDIEMMASFYPNVLFVTEWWKQLYGESEGKGGKGIFPASTILSTDLHSMGQMMQDGKRNIFETFVAIESVADKIAVPNQADDLDKFNCVAGKDLDWVNKQAYKATADAHFEGGVPNMTITLDRADAFHLGQLYYFFEKGVGISGYLLGVNPFDQPGVEAYKKKMFALLGKK
ncbi:MAG: glucose-6-phosphate isomerase [Candidatus Omnitrophica bacterium]|nr:glucose-6-phosphate isomerase [Candidatus Omnitrophota bacterium]